MPSSPSQQLVFYKTDHLHPKIVLLKDHITTIPVSSKLKVRDLKAELDERAEVICRDCGSVR